MKILITGGAGFIGSNLTKRLLDDKKISLVRVLDNFSTGKRENIAEFAENPRFQLLEGDIRDPETCRQAVSGIDRISHQAALGSVPRSINDPLTTNAVNVTGALNMFYAAKEAGIDRIIYAASSSTYGDHPGLPKQEDLIGRPLSPYAVTKFVNELYADVFKKTYNLDSVGLRYFNVFGPKQDPDGAYAAVIPLFVKCALENFAPFINGDGLHSRDFTYVDNAVNANCLALFTNKPEALNQVYNVACGQRTSLLELWEGICAIEGKTIPPIHRENRAGDVAHSLADISKISQNLDYKVLVTVHEGLGRAYDWYKNNLA